MNRRNFLASLIALPAGLVAAAKAPALPSGVLARMSDLYSLKVNPRDTALVIGIDSSDRLTHYWFQTPRTRFEPSPAYVDALEKILAGQESTDNFLSCFHG